MASFDSIEFLSKRPLLQEVSASRLNLILDEIKRTRPLAGRGISVRHSGGGVVISSLDPGSTNVTPLRPVPWDISSSREPESDNFTLRVVPGTISNILPSNWDEEFSAQQDQLKYGIATISTDGKAITSIEIDIATQAPSQQVPQKFGIESSVEYLFGLFINGCSYNVLQESIYLYPRLRLVTSASPPAAPGESPFDLWYELGT